MKYTHFWQLVFVKVQLNLKSEASKSYLSYVWWVLEPALFVGVFFLVFGIFLANKDENFVAFLVCGKIPFLWFSRSVSNAADSISGGRGLMNQILIPKIYFPTVIIGQDFIKSIVVMGLMAMVMWLYGFDPHITWFSFPLIIITQLFFVAAVAYIGAAIVPFIPDFRYLITTGIMLTMFASGIFYSYEDLLLPKHQDIFLLNPLANLIKNYRDVLMSQNWPDWNALILICIGSLVMILVTHLFLKKYDSVYPRLVIQ